MPSLLDLETPVLVLDRCKLDRNLARMHEHVHSLGCVIRPHVKTAKSIDVVRRSLLGEPGGITVSTLKEAEYFFEHGIQDITYAVGLAPNKVEHVAALIQRGANLTVLLDNLAVVASVAQGARAAGVTIPVLIELDVDGHRSGVAPSSALLLEVARAVKSAAGLVLRGVLTHAGSSYDCRTVEALRQMAEHERSGAVSAADRLKAAGLPISVVSIGSTPSVTFSRNLAGVTEVRAGVYVFQDLVMAGVGVCALDDIALSVLVSVIGHQSEKGWIITDGGWAALSRDRGTSSQPVDQGYGVVLDESGKPTRDDLIVLSTNQEHGVVARRDGESLSPAEYPVGMLLRVLPNHACATGAQHAAYHVVEGEGQEVLEVWPRFSGW